MTSAQATLAPTDPPFRITDPLPTGTTLLEASAGTGKTWTIASLVTRYVAEGVCAVDEMLVVTFGRAASQELRERVREQLVAAERALAVDSPADLDGMRAADPRIEPLLPLLRAGTPADVAERRARLRTALADFDAATIATTHEFCHLVLSSLGVAGDTDAGAELVEDLDELLTEVVDDLYIRGFAAAEGPPLFTRSEALGLARAVVSNPRAELEPAVAPTDGVRRRVAFGAAVRAETDRRKRRLGVLGYDDLLGQLADALEQPDAPARARMRGRWRVVLVDEFQDTDPVQWQVLDRAFSGVATMVLIGDPKQAIYAFRGGDVTTYLAAAHTAGRRASLDTNQRADADLVAALLAVLEGAELGDPEIVVGKVRSRHGRRLVGAPHPAPFRLRVVERAAFGARGTSGVTIGPLRAHVNADLAADIGALLASGATFDGHPLVARHIAVLCETNTQCRAAQAALARRGIPCVVGGAGSVFDTEGARLWRQLLEAMEQPHRSARVRAAALTPFFGRTAEELDLGGEALTDEISEIVRDWAQLLRQRGVAAVFEAASSTGALAERVLSRVDGERLLTDLRHTGEVLHEEAAREGLTVVALVAWMRQQMSQDHQVVASERSRRLDSDASAVQILTIHGSKGLQFPVVYLPTLSDSYARTPVIPLYHDESDRRCLDVGGGDLSGRPGFQRHRDEEAGEDLRVLYVALTRAQSQVVTWWVPSKTNTSGSALHRILFGRSPGQAAVPASAPLLSDTDVVTRAREWEALGGPVVERSRVLDPPAIPAAASPASLRSRVFTRGVDDQWRRTSYSSLAAGAREAEAGALPPSSEPEETPKDDERDPLATDLADPQSAGAAAHVRSPMADLPVGATFGSLVHGVLEHADPAAPERGGDLRAELLHQVGEQLVRWPVELDRGLLVNALVAVSESPLGPLAGCRLVDVPARDRMTELDFELPLAGGDGRRAGGGGNGRGGSAGPASPGGPAATVRQLAGLMRTHLPGTDPLLPFADLLDHPAYGAQELRGYLTGSLDLVFRVQGRYLVADYKTNWLGPIDDELTSQAYTPAALATAMTTSTYPLQAMLYSVVLHRFLRWRVPGYTPDTHLGGVLYLYVRGMCGAETPFIDGQPCGVFSWRPPAAFVEAASALLDGQAGEAS